MSTGIQSILAAPVRITNQHWPEGITPLVSIINNTYNHESFIREALESFLGQETTFPVEILVHDDASTDDTAEIIKEYELKYPGLVLPVYQKENQYSKGVKLTQNFQYPRARGKYIALCEGDDYWTDPLKLQKQVEFLEANEEYVMCFHEAEIDSFDGKSRLNIYDHLENRDYSGLEILKKWTVPTASVVFRTEILNKKLPPSHPDFLFSDIILFLHLVEFGKIHCLANKMSVYRVHLSGVSMNPSKLSTLKYIKHHIAIQESFYGKYKNKTNTIIANGYKDLSKYFLKQMSLRLAVFYLIKYFLIRFK